MHRFDVVASEERHAIVAGDRYCGERRARPCDRLTFLPMMPCAARAERNNRLRSSPFYLPKPIAARPLYPRRLPRRPFAIAAVQGQEATSQAWHGNESCRLIGNVWPIEPRRAREPRPRESRLMKKLLIALFPLFATTLAQADQLISCPLKYGFVNVVLASGPQNSAIPAGIHMCTTPADAHTYAADCQNVQAEGAFENNKNKLTVCTMDRTICVVIDRTDRDVPLVVLHMLLDKDDRVSPDGTRKVMAMQSKCFLYPLRGSATDGVMTW